LDTGKRFHRTHKVDKMRSNRRLATGQSDLCESNMSEEADEPQKFMVS
jgi:hypothetical protein